MAFEDLWEKYGEQQPQADWPAEEEPAAAPAEKQQPRPAPAGPEESWQRPETRRQTKADPGDTEPAASHTAPVAGWDDQVEGVFGEKRDCSPQKTGLQKTGPQKAGLRKPGRPSKGSLAPLDFSAAGSWSWLDIGFWAVTAVVVVGVLLNFEAVTTAVFLALLGLIEGLFQIIVIVALIAAVLWWISRRTRRRW